MFTTTSQRYFNMIKLKREECKEEFIHILLPLRFVSCFPKLFVLLI